MELELKKDLATRESKRHPLEAELLSIEKVILEGPEMTGITSVEATYLIRERNIISKTFSAIIDLCSRKVNKWYPVEKTL